LSPIRKPDFLEPLSNFQENITPLAAAEKQNFDKKSQQKSTFLINKQQQKTKIPIK
jgi:hypothetical protein